MKKLWEDRVSLNKAIEAFETEGDLLLDQKLIPYDLQGSLAHAKMLKKIGILSSKELEMLETGLDNILDEYKAGKFVLQLGDEDMHTKIENYLILRYGTVGKKIHTARSRNDQVLTALRLLMKAELAKIRHATITLIRAFKTAKRKYGAVPMPGYTHMQKAMPSSVGLWLQSFITALQDDLQMIDAVYTLIDQSPLGTGAGYGLPIPLDRKYTADVLGFKKVLENPIYAQHSRGKFEAAVLACLVQVLLTVNKFASDIMLFTTSEFDFFHVSDDLTTGSSIMPQKRNVDIAELLRSKVHIVLGNYMQVVSLSSNLTSGYNRDMQDSKKPLMESLENTLQSITVTETVAKNITPNEANLKSAMTDELFTTEKALKLVLQGRSFRDAYQDVKDELRGGEKHEAANDIQKGRLVRSKNR